MPRLHALHKCNWHPAPARRGAHSHRSSVPHFPVSKSIPKRNQIMQP